MNDAMTVSGSRDAPESWEPVLSAVRRYAHTASSSPAVRCGEDELDYRTLVDAAEGLADRLTGLGVGAGDRVAILCRPSTAMVVGVLGVLSAGAAYVPVEPSQPDARIRAILGDADVAAVITDEEAVRGLWSAPVIVIGRDAPSQTNSMTGSGGSPSAPMERSTHDDAHVVYTSGRTGEPKGVVVGHRQLAWSSWARRTVYPGSSTFLLLSPLAFDSSVAGLWGTLTSGGCLVVASADDVRDPEALVALMARHCVTRTLCVPSLHRQIIEAAKSAGEHPLPSLKTVTVAGESLPDALIERHFAVLPGVMLVNEYGPSEGTVWATYRRYTAPAKSTIGGPDPGVQLHVVDERLKPVPDGERGELCIGSPGVANGYLGQVAATAKSFFDDPWGGDRRYRTGDTVRWNDDGELEFLGRRDGQVKIRGQRIELGGVEAALLLAPGVQEAVVLPDAERTALVAHLVLDDGADVAGVRRYLAERLPSGHLPGRVVVHEQMPLNSNGKIDRRALEVLIADAPEALPRDVGVEVSEATSSDVSGQVAAAWAEVLGLVHVPPEVNFFDLGGHSLAMLKLRDALERHTGVQLTVVTLFRHTTVAGQADFIRGAGKGSVAADAVGHRSERRARASQALRRRRRLNRGKE